MAVKPKATRKAKPKATTAKKPKSWKNRLFWFVLALWLLSILPVITLRYLPPHTSAFMIWRQWQATQSGDADFRLWHWWMNWRDLGVEMPLAVVAAEDQKFPLHRGFDVDSIKLAVQEARSGGRMRGASTISQQVAKNLFLWSGPSFVRKGLEAYFTVAIELIWSKQRILEVYLNIAEFGDGVYGVGAAARRLFNKSPTQLSRREAALLASVLPSPKRFLANRPDDYVNQRAAWVQVQMTQLGGAYLRDL